MTNAPLVSGENQLPSSDELIFRQITPQLWSGGDAAPALYSFGPQPSDKGKPSFSRSSKVSAQQSFEWHNKNAHSESHGVWACTVDEVCQAKLRVVDDSAVNAGAAPGHCYVDYRSLSKAEERERRAILARFAISRGIQYPT